MREIGIGAALAAGIFLIAHYPTLLPILLMAGLAVILLRTVGGLPGMKPRFASVRAARGPGAAARVTFDDIGGQATAKKELLEALDFLRHGERVRRMGIRPLKGILLTGPPGTGKTLLAKAAATYTGSVFIASSGSEFIEVYAGVGAQRVRELFRKARDEARQKSASAIVFIDEIEVVGGKRGRHQSHLEYDQTLNQLLVEMDGMTADDGVRVLVMAATNRSDLLDDALLRPGRFDRIVRVDLPDREGRRQILNLHARGKPLAGDVDLDRVARATFGFSGTHLESLTNEAAILAMREGLESIPERCFHDAVDKVMLGEKLDRRPTVDEKRRIAVHEAGHALIGELLDPGSVARVTVTARGQALGFVRQVPHDDIYLYTQARLEIEIQRLLAGSLAEDLVLGGRSTGAASDFEQVLRLTSVMVASGMSRLGIVQIDALPEGQLQQHQSQIIAQMETRVRGTLGECRPALEATADVLLEEESIDGERVRALLGQPPAGRSDPAGATRGGPLPAVRKAMVAGAAGVPGHEADRPVDPRRRSIAGPLLAARLRLRRGSTAGRVAAPDAVDGAGPASGGGAGTTEKV